MNRLVKAEYSNGNAAYQYDASGNRAQEDLTDKRASEGVNGRANDDNPNKPIFDLVYDEQDRLRLVRDLATKQELARYEYNFRGQRVKKTTSSGAIISTYDSNNLVAEYDGQLNPLANYVNGIDPIVCNDLKNGNTSYYQYNHLGSVVNLVGSGGQLLNSYRYDVWGVIRVRISEDREKGFQKIVKGDFG